MLPQPPPTSLSNRSDGPDTDVTVDVHLVTLQSQFALIPTHLMMQARNQDFVEGRAFDSND